MGPLESETRLLVDKALENLGYNAMDTNRFRHTYTEWPRTPEEQKKLQGRRRRVPRRAHRGKPLRSVLPRYPTKKELKRGQRSSAERGGQRRPRYPRTGGGGGSVAQQAWGQSPQYAAPARRRIMPKFSERHSYLPRTEYFANRSTGNLTSLCC
jgi:hypothetical protein